MIRKFSFYSLIIFFVFAGLYHFINPDFYYPLIPDYFPFKKTINIASGVIEIFLGLGLLFDKYRRYVAHMLILLMVAFVPSHIHFIVIGGCVDEGLCVPEWIGWLRLIIIHPLLIMWIYSHRK